MLQPRWHGQSGSTGTTKLMTYGGQGSVLSTHCSLIRTKLEGLAIRKYLLQIEKQSLLYANKWWGWWGRGRREKREGSGNLGKRESRLMGRRKHLSDELNCWNVNLSSWVGAGVRAGTVLGKDGPAFRGYRSLGKSLTRAFCNVWTTRLLHALLI